ncbi:hypothetical protein BAL199_17293 [alpha proteobacterium BAL199]|nr:hypothetical protein BAL199_17293 [alpha proteobacterium BAL199]
MAAAAAVLLDPGLVMAEPEVRPVSAGTVAAVARAFLVTEGTQMAQVTTQEPVAQSALAAVRGRLVVLGSLAHSELAEGHSRRPEVRLRARVVGGQAVQAPAHPAACRGPVQRVVDVEEVVALVSLGSEEMAVMAAAVAAQRQVDLVVRHSWLSNGTRRLKEVNVVCCVSAVTMIAQRR